jgi:hypothetical protein
VSQQFPMPAWAPKKTAMHDERELFLWVVER